MLGIFTAHRDWVPAVARPPGHMQAVQVRPPGSFCCRCCWCVLCMLPLLCCVRMLLSIVAQVLTGSAQVQIAGVSRHGAMSTVDKQMCLCVIDRVIIVFVTCVCGLQEAMAIIVDAMQAYFTPVRFYSRQAKQLGAVCKAAGAALLCNWGLGTSPMPCASCGVVSAAGLKQPPSAGHGTQTLASGGTPTLATAPPWYTLRWSARGRWVVGLLAQVTLQGVCRYKLQAWVPSACALHACFGHSAVMFYSRQSPADQASDQPAAGSSDPLTTRCMPPHALQMRRISSSMEQLEAATLALHGSSVPPQLIAQVRPAATGCTLQRLCGGAKLPCLHAACMLAAEPFAPHWWSLQPC